MPAAAANKMRVGRRGDKGDKAGLAASAKRTRPVTVKGADVAAATASAPAARALARRRAANCCSRSVKRQDELEAVVLQLRHEVLQQRDEIRTLERAVVSWGAMEDQLAKAALMQKVKSGTLEVTVGQLILALDTLKRELEEKCGDGKGRPAVEGRGPKTPPAGMCSLGELVHVGVPAQQLSSLTNYLARGDETTKSNKEQQQQPPVAVVASASAPASEFLRLSPTNLQLTEGGGTGGVATGGSEGSLARQVSGMEGAGESDGGTMAAKSDLAKSAVCADSSREETCLRLATSQFKINGSEVFPGIVAMEPILDAIDADKHAAVKTDLCARRRGFGLYLDIPPTGAFEGEGEEEGGVPAGEDKTESDVAALTMMALQKSLLMGVGSKPSLGSGEARARPGGVKIAGKPPRPPTSPGAISTLRVIGLPPAANGGGEGPVRPRRGMQCRTLGPGRIVPPPSSSWQDSPREAPTKQEGKATDDVAPKEEKDREGGQQQLYCTPGGPRATGTGPEGQAGRRKALGPPGSVRKYKRTKTAGGGAPVIAGGEGGAFHPVVLKPKPVHHSEQVRPLWCGSDSRYQIWWRATPGVAPVQAAAVGDPARTTEAINLTASE